MIRKLAPARGLTWSLQGCPLVYYIHHFELPKACFRHQEIGTGIKLARNVWRLVWGGYGWGCDQLFTLSPPLINAPVTQSVLSAQWQWSRETWTTLCESQCSPPTLDVTYNRDSKHILLYFSKGCMFSYFLAGPFT